MCRRALSIRGTCSGLGRPSETAEVTMDVDRKAGGRQDGAATWMSELPASNPNTDGSLTSRRRRRLRVGV